jgi:hypothetical protein
MEDSCLSTSAALIALKALQLPEHRLRPGAHETGHLDPHLVNGWGLAYLPASPFWVADNFTGVSTLDTSKGDVIPHNLLVVKKD